MTLHFQQQLCIAINVLGGLAVLASYCLPFILNTSGDALWGGVPSSLKPLYALSMILAALGYLAFSNLIIFRIDPVAMRVFGNSDYPLFLILYCLILFSSAAWMPLTLSMIANPTSFTFFAIRSILLVVGLSALVLFISLFNISPRPSGFTYWLGVGGSFIFCLHTLVLDAIVWPYFFVR